MRYQLRYVRLPHVPEGCAARQLYPNKQVRSKPAVHQRVSPSFRLRRAWWATRPLDGPARSPPQENCRLAQAVTAYPPPRSADRSAILLVQASNESGTGIELSSRSRR